MDTAEMKVVVINASYAHHHLGRVINALDRNTVYVIENEMIGITTAVVAHPDILNRLGIAMPGGNGQGEHNE